MSCEPQHPDARTDPNPLRACPVAAASGAGEPDGPAGPHPLPAVSRSPAATTPTLRFKTSPSCHPTVACVPGSRPLPPASRPEPELQPIGSARSLRVCASRLFHELGRHRAEARRRGLSRT